MNRRATALFGICIAVLSVAVSISRASTDLKSSFDLPAEALDKALRDFAIQAHCNISYEPSAVAGLQAPAIKGEFTPASALSMMLAGTRLQAVSVNEDTIRVEEKPASKSQNTTPTAINHNSAGSGAIRVAHAEAESTVPLAPPSAADVAGPDSNDVENRNRKDLDEITVTGTHIRGVANSATPIQVYSRAEIDATGSMTVQQFLQTLPQNFSGGASDSTANGMSGGGQSNNHVGGSAANLRGLGNDATLVLVDGHRVAPGNTDANFVDISMIPLTAIERIEVVTDGASAIYGADAVGGVVNIILRHQFDGFETRAQYGSVDSGSDRAVQVGQTVGQNWATGSAVLSYQYSDQTPLHAADRSFTQLISGTDLSPSQVQHAAFATFSQEITREIAVWGDATFAHRDTNSHVNLPIYSYSERDPNTIDGYGVVVGTKMDLPHRSQLDISANYSESDTHSETLSPISDSNVIDNWKTKTAIVSLDANVDGVLATLPAGRLRYAAGAQYRRESFGHNNLEDTTEQFYPRRSTAAGYAELHIPLLGSTEARGESSMELTLADRSEHYSDFGSTNNPHVGMIWKATPKVAFRGTWGTSFKAPLLSQLNPVLSGVNADAVADPAKGGTCDPFAQGPKGTCTTELVEFGGNAQLKPEKATIWTLGVDVKPEALKGLSANLTYYRILIKDQITYPATTVDIFEALNDETILGPSIVQRNPPSKVIAQLMSLPSYVNYYGADTSTIGALVDFRYQNLSIVKTNGLDFGASYKTDVLEAQVECGADGTYIFAFKNTFTNTAPTASLLNTPYNPVDLRLRGRAIVTRGQFSLGVFLNFVNAYSDNIFTPATHVPSWTTADASLGYDFRSGGAVLSGLSVGLNVINLTGRDPPNVPGNNFGVNYDGANSNALGRFYTLRIGKRF
jgi:iron complex outermembrane receptor protein